MIGRCAEAQLNHEQISQLPAAELAQYVERVARTTATGEEVAARKNPLVRQTLTEAFEHLAFFI